MTEEFIRQFVDSYWKISERATEIAKEIRKIQGEHEPKYWLNVSFESDTVKANWYDSWKYGGHEEGCEEFPIHYLWTDNWQEKHRTDWEAKESLEDAKKREQERLRAKDELDRAQRRFAELNGGKR